ncbi:ABC transporter permease [Sphingopyxis terrae]|uniref:Putative ABC transport system permease protein n=1 Tax=Sphingopyxis terrae subsp. ummariensis TaxID=429001 RepID=A0A1Y6FVC1_9SPHN|nr:FtsX-like permease family protein [Sphingopyxis terrae]SMQ79552.1 putative ABC transport system permease protein [Sphingopyxis terrae subsp. ummariensis]
MVKALDLKLMRDLWRMRGQVMAIALVLAAASATFVLSLGVHLSLTETRDAYYAQSAFADIFVDLTRAPRSIVTRVADIPGVRRAEGSIRQYATLVLPERSAPARALINALDDRGSTVLNRLTLRAGRLPDRDRPGEVVADEAFVKANGFALGARLDAVIYGRKQPLTIVGVGLSPDYIYSIAPGDLIPDNSRFGIFWMSEKALEAATGRSGAINRITLTVERGASEAEIIRRLDLLLAPYGGTGAYGRADHISHAFLDNELMQLEAMTRVIPPVFLIVSTFLVYIVLGRLIRTERTLIGLIKAFGYPDRAIAWHYLKFALVTALVATLIGSLAGIWMGRGMTSLYAEYYRFPILRYHISPAVFVGAAILAAGSAGLGALGGMRAAVQLSPAVAMAPPPPPVYRSGAVERIGRLAGLSVIGHMILRHIARWPARSAMTIFGVALSMGLLFATMQFLDSSRAMLDSYFFRSQRHDLIVTFTEPRGPDAVFALAQLPGVLRFEATRAIAVKLHSENRTERTAIEAAPARSQLLAHIDRNGREISLPPAGLMLSRQLADQLGVRAGDTLDLEMLGGRRTQLRMPVATIVDEFVGARAYASEATLDRIARDAAPVGAALLRIDPAARESILNALKGMPAVLGVTERDAALRLFERMIDDNLFTMLFFYIGFASAITVGVVYNSARILFSERAHELATLRVLGYHRREVALILLGELALLVVAAVPVGCLIGYWMAQLMTAMFSSDLFRLPFAPARSTYGYAILVVLAAAMATAALVARRVLGLDMIRVLKARE